MYHMDGTKTKVEKENLERKKLYEINECLIID